MQHHINNAPHRSSYHSSLVCLNSYSLWHLQLHRCHVKHCLHSQCDSSKDIFPTCLSSVLSNVLLTDYVLTFLYSLVNQQTLPLAFHTPTKNKHPNKSKLYYYITFMHHHYLLQIFSFFLWNRNQEFIFVQLLHPREKVVKQTTKHL